MNLVYTALSEPGRRRTENQDSVLAVSAPGRHLLVVADGVGGLADGAQASQSTVRALEESFARTDRPYGPEQLVADLAAVNSSIVEDRDRNEGRMSGSTVVAILFEPAAASFVVAHVGDSRAYLLRDGALERLTEDHSLVAEQVRAGILTDEEAASSRHRHVITRSIGIEQDLSIELSPARSLKPGDRFLLCSDGLTDLVGDAELERLLSGQGDQRNTARVLVDLANDRGGPDNISVVVADVEGV